MVKLDKLSPVLVFQSLQFIYELINVRVCFGKGTVKLGMQPFKVVIGSRTNVVMLVPHTNHHKEFNCLYNTIFYKIIGV
jgi:hypothetical protein